MKYTKEDFLKAAELGEVSMIDARHIVSLLDEVTQLPQQEISDEEIEKKAKQYTFDEYGKFDYVKYDTYDNYNDFIAGAKWYREQLKR